MKIPRIPHKDDLLTIEVVALLFEAPVSMIERLVEMKAMPVIKEDGMILFRIGDLDSHQQDIQRRLIELILEDGARCGHFEKDAAGRYRMTEAGRKWWERNREA